MKLNGTWVIAYTEESPGRIGIPSEFKGKLPVPGCWDDYPEAFKDYSAKTNEEHREMDLDSYGTMPFDGSLPFITGTVWYGKTINIFKKNEYSVLKAGRVCLDAAIYLNHELIGYHIGFSTNFEIVLPALEPGMHELVIAVTNTRRDRIGCLVRGFKGYSGGIFGDVELKTCNNASVRKLYIHPDEDLKKLNWQVELHGHTENIILHAKVFKEGELIDEIRISELTFQTDAGKFKPWSDDDPQLYQVELTLLRDGREIDRLTQTFGMRRLTADGMGLRLNGTPVFLRGNTEHAYFAESCTPPLEKSYYLNVVCKFKGLGFNWLRFHTATPTEEYMQACDELGMLIQVEAPVGFGMEEWEDIVRGCRHHPSVVIYCPGNEENLSSQKISYLEHVAATTKRIAPDALFNPQEALRGIEYCWQNTNTYGFPVVNKPFPHNPVKLRKLEEFSDVLGHFSWGMLSYKSSSCDLQELDRRLAYYCRPCLSHEVCIHGTYLDFNLERRYERSRIGSRVYEKGRQNVTAAGLIDQADLYYQNSCRWQQTLRKHALENARASRYLVGYDLLGAIDYHWHRYGYNCGIMNEFYELKPHETATNVLSYNGRSVLLIDKDSRYCYWNTDRLAFSIRISCFEPGGIHNSLLEVQLTDPDGTVVGCKYRDIKRIECGNVVELGTFEFHFPDCDKATKYTIQASVGNISNHWPVWCFNHINSTAPDGIIETDCLDHSLVSAVSNGGKCILYGKGPFPAIDTKWQISCAGRAEGNLATVIHDHSAWGDFPHENWCEWQFAEMINGAEAVNFTNLEMAFMPILEMVSSYKNVKRQAMIFEVKIGKGLLLVCTLNLDATPVAGAYLKKCLRQYAANPEAGRNAIPVEMQTLFNLIDNIGETETIAPTDQGFDALGQLIER